MRTTTLFAAVCLLACATASVHANDNDYYAYISLNLQWPFTNGCSSDCHQMFTIHGMWPSVGTSGPSYCGGTFDPNDLDPIMSEMNYAWPSYQGENDSFWSHEWEKHGTCAKQSPGMGNEFDFFNTTLTIWSNLRIMDALSAAGIYPSNSQSYKVSDMVSAIENKIGSAPVIGCDSGDVNTMAICFDRDLNIGYCPSDVTGCDRDSYVRLPSSSDYYVRSA